jgi:D-sedoheptulose 7-phosphate isomerase
MSPIREYILHVQEVLGKISDTSVAQVVTVLFAAWKQRKQVIVLGNGGSASTASHMVNDFCKATIVAGKPRMRALALTDCVSLITAWANDVSYDSVFREQLENFMNRGDVVLGISASGNSPNVLHAMEFAGLQGAITIGWTGQSGGKLKSLVDYCLHAPSDDVGIIESVHMLLEHLVTKELRYRIQQDGKIWEHPQAMASSVASFAGDMSSLRRGIRRQRTDRFNSTKGRYPKKLQRQGNAF